MKHRIISLFIIIVATICYKQNISAQVCIDPICQCQHPVLEIVYIDLQNDEANVPYSFTIDVPGEVIGVLPEILTSWTDNGDGTITITLSKRFFIDASPNSIYCMNIAVNTPSGQVDYCLDLIISNNPY